MKKVIITIIIFLGLTASASAFYYDNALVNLWNSRKDLQKAFPGDPLNNVKLEKWAKERGWKESPELFNYYPDKQIVEKIIDNKYEARIVALESQIKSLNDQILSYKAQTVQPITQPVVNNSRDCYLDANRGGNVLCPIINSDYSSYDNGKVPIKLLIN